MSDAYPVIIAPEAAIFESDVDHVLRVRVDITAAGDVVFAEVPGATTNRLDRRSRSQPTSLEQT